MTRKDYVLISKAIESAPITDKKGDMLSVEAMRHDITRALAKAISAENPNFNAQKFIQACGFGR